MCIVSIAWQAHPDWKLVAIGNRDELHARRADPLSRWSDHDHVLAGRDVKAGGTWLGVSEQGRFAVVTNVAGYGMPDPGMASRGDLLRDFLTQDGRYANLESAAFSAFNPFNLITVDGDDASIHSNRPDGSSDLLAPGLYGLSNGALHDPWPKSHRLNDALAHWLEGGSADPDILFDRLLDQEIYQTSGSRADKNEAPIEPRNSPIFIRSPAYGTRCSTVFLLDNYGKGRIIERPFSSTGEQAGETDLSFNWPR